ncbi:zinc finger HIT domain-containing protein 1 [Gymnodraco acuticeps]|uniref:Zinc finger HIT domain-containing protein 1 n=1 Tax=Gymnodraco acuticeps TaxID=8218 RepID=A0A6P8UXH8_GYMAC|nr:zinc finger HIT domain-containing protein 1 [Gymnodraco acuticeps]
MVLEKKSSARVEADSRRRVLDEATRQRRLSRQLEALEKDNFQDDPLSSLPPQVLLPAYLPSARQRSQVRGLNQIEMKLIIHSKELDLMPFGFTLCLWYNMADVSLATEAKLTIDYLLLSSCGRSRFLQAHLTFSL